MDLGQLAIVILLLALVYTVRNGFNEVIKGLQSIDERLSGSRRD